MSSRIDRLHVLLEEHEADALVLTFLPDVRWACGFTGSNGLLIVRNGQAHFLSDGRYRLQAQHEVEGARIHIPGYDLVAYAAEQQLLGAGERVLFQAEYVTVAQRDELQGRFDGVEWVAAAGLLQELVAVKDAEEVARIRAAQAVTDAVFSELLGIIKPGMTERELAAEIVYRHMQRGAEKMSFDPIVASGPNGALPHARPSDRRLQAGELVLLDFGCILDGYASDMTRTIALGEPDEEMRRVYDVVLDAQRAALEAALGNMSSRLLDSAARGVIEQAGYGQYFSHGLGHGLGLQVHEWPRVSYHVDETLPEGAVVTIEPGIYLPDRFGVRIEDLIVLQAGGCDNLTQSTKELVVL